MKKLSILGATVCVGTNCLDVIANQPSDYEVLYLSIDQYVDHLLHLAFTLSLVIFLYVYWC